MENDHKLTSTQSVMEVEYLPVELAESSLVNTTKIPIAEFSKLGSAFAPASQALLGFLNGQGGKSGFYWADVKKGQHLAQIKKTKEFIGGTLNTNNQVSGQARLHSIPIDPTMMMMGFAIMRVEKKLDDIKEIQKDILTFLQLKEKSILRGNLAVLEDVQKNYKYNWNNEKYKNNKHIQVQEIKRDSEQSIIFFRDQIANELSKQNLIHIGQEVKKKTEKFKSDLQEYQLSLYLFAYASFLEVMLLENFASAYLSSVTDRIESYAIRYRELYTQCYEQIESYSKTSVDSRLIGGLASLNKAAGDAVSKIPLAKKGQIDEKLTGAGEWLGKFNDKMTEKSLAHVLDAKNSYVHPFVESITTIDALYNQSSRILFDQEFIYIDNHVTA